MTSFSAVGSAKFDGNCLSYIGRQIRSNGCPVFIPYVAITALGICCIGKPAARRLVTHISNGSAALYSISFTIGKRYGKTRLLVGRVSGRILEYNSIEISK